MPKAVEHILRAGLAFAFIYPAVAGYLNPFSWIGYFPEFLRDSVGNDTLLLNGFGSLEIAIALWTLSGWRIFVPSILAAVILVGIILFNAAQMDVIFRDVSILAIALALALTSRKNQAPA